MAGRRPLVIRAWLWLAAQANALGEKRRCLEAVLELDPENEMARLALQVMGSVRTDESTRSCCG